MDLIALGKYVNLIESRHVNEIHKIRFLGFNTWQLYRLQLLPKDPGKRNSCVPRVRKKNLLAFLRAAAYRLIGTLFDDLRKLLDAVAYPGKYSGKVAIITTSASYHGRENNTLVSHLLSVLNEEIGTSRVINIVQIRKEDLWARANCKPAMHVEDAQLQVGVILQWLVALLMYPVCYAHYKHLRTFMDITLTRVMVILGNFTVKYCYYRLFFMLINPKYVILYTSSYGQEYKIAALKRNRVTTYEYQHAQLYQEHYGYNYCEQLRSIKPAMILPDKMILYGSYWRDVLISNGFFDSEYFIIGGNPYFKDVRKLTITRSDHTPILIMSSPQASEYIMEFIDNYEKNTQYGATCYWVVKPHPREDEGLWRDFIDGRQNIELSACGTHTLLNSMSIVLTASPSIVYESLYFNCSPYFFIMDLNVNNSKSWKLSNIRVIDNTFTEKIVTYAVQEDASCYFQDFTLTML